jgi:hypothetical protein
LHEQVCIPLTTLCDEKIDGVPSPTHETDDQAAKVVTAQGWCHLNHSHNPHTHCFIHTLI